MTTLTDMDLRRWVDADDGTAIAWAYQDSGTGHWVVRVLHRRRLTTSAADRGQARDALDTLTEHWRRGLA